MKGHIVTVAATATVVAGADPGNVNAGPGSASYPTAVLIKNPASGVIVYFGGCAVSTAAGFPLAAGESLEVDLVNEILFAIVASGTQQINILRRGD